MDEINTILKANMIGTLATLNEDGSPWATPVHIIAHKSYVYWFSEDTHQHSQNVVRDSRVSVSLWSKDEGTKGVYINGDAERLEGKAADHAFAMVKEKFGSIPPVFENTSPYRVAIGMLNSSKSSENRWYFYTEKS